ncbi:hypothetical protein VP01_1207g7 [Puccinia sorghi]|uniref:Late embryogenesis abundant protein LEA-2 subgroup domain-containing protein n=1 Tax=Puccinia sorghi TaxID=27349 RepID=A0A0L6VQG3_9BASI|nr:hypothetical protein VP01_1207g7 [Puccinia sorghi]
MSQPYYNHSDNRYEQGQHYPQQQYYPQEEFIDQYHSSNYQQQPHDLNQHHHTHQYPPPADIYNQPYPDQHHPNTYPPDHHYHPDEAYHPEYDPAYALDEKYHHAESYPPANANLSPINLNEAAPTPRLNTSSTYANPTRGSVAAQMAAEGAIPEKAGLRMWRSDEHSGAFTRGGKSQSCRRCCCCTFIVIILVIVGFIAGFLLWVRPPNATFNGIAPPTAGNQVDLQPKGFLLNFDLNVCFIGVTNPNFFGASFSKISAKAYYPLNKTAALGGGELENVDIKPHSNTTINFPFQINYTTSLDPNRAILADIASRCGFLNNPKNKLIFFPPPLSDVLRPIKISFDITLKLKVLAITISPTFSSSNTFTCPLKQSDFTSVLGGAQSMDALSNLLTGSSAGSDAKPRLARRATSTSSEETGRLPLSMRLEETDLLPLSQDGEDRLIEDLVNKALSASSAPSSSQLVLSRVRFIPPDFPAFSFLD